MRNTIFIQSLLLSSENVSLECKKAEGGLPKSLWETYSAFANTNGGIILLGIEEDKTAQRQFTATGLKDVAKMKKEFWDTVNSDKVSENILVDSDVWEDTLDGKDVLVVRVPRADSRQRPVFINGNVMKGTYRRNFEGDYHCSESEIRAMLRDSDDAGNDGMMIEHYTMMDIDRETLQSYRNRFRVFNEDHVWNDVNDRQFLINLGGYTVNRENGMEGLTLAGLLMFGTGLAIRERFDNFRMDYLDLTNLLPGSRWSDRLTYDGRWENNLYNFYTRVQSKLTAHLKRPFRMEGMVRIDDTPVHKAVREALTNAIIHADYFVSGGVLRIEKRDHGFLFSNPGSLKISIEELFRGGTSKARNPRIQNMMRMVGMGENIGSGFPTIVKAWEDEHWQRPVVEEKLQSQVVNLMLNVEDEYFERTIQKNEDIIQITKTDEQEVAGKVAGKTQKGSRKSSKKKDMVLNLIAKIPSISYPDLAFAMDMSVAGVRKIMDKLRAEGRLRRVGPDKGGHWEIIR